MAKLPAPTGAPLDLGGHVEFYSDGIVDIEQYGANSRLISHCVRRWTGGLVALSSSA